MSDSLREILIKRWTFSLDAEQLETIERENTKRPSGYTKEDYIREIYAYSLDQAIQAIKSWAVGKLPEKCNGCGFDRINCAHYNTAIDQMKKNLEEG